jgi:putative tryptophan/tyrosine transport system substrate-binding protein
MTSDVRHKADIGLPLPNDPRRLLPCLFLSLGNASMRRRDFIKGLGGLAIAWPLTARAQQTGPARRIGVLIPFENENDPQVRDLWPAFKQRLAELGWVEGRNIQFDVHFTTQNIDRIRAGAAEIAASGPELIYVWSNPGLAAMKQATQTIPIVFVLVSDPVGGGLVANLAHPGGNITGFRISRPTSAENGWNS